MQIIFTDGLGNQMFQYALYLALKANGRSPQINTGIASRSKVHNGFELCNAFEIDEDEIPIVMNGRIEGGLTILGLRYFKKLLCYSEDKNIPSYNVFKTRKLFVDGYWQNIRYFENVQNEVRDAFTFRNIDKVNSLLGEEIEKCNSVSIHIRRGDYLNYPQYQVCTPSYYKRAISLVREKVENPIFYVFSDDIEWSDLFMREFGVNYKIVDQNRGRDSYKDMYLMTRCRHNIIANSSFSWWGAWLGNYKEKIVVCPSEWIKNQPKDPCLDNWLKTSVLSSRGYYGVRRTWFEILCHEYEELKTGRTPVFLFAMRAFRLSDVFRLRVQMRYMFNTKSLSKKRRLSRNLIHKYGAEISPLAVIGERFTFHHTVGIVIGDYVRIGNDCHIFQGVLLGQSKGVYPIVGNNVTLYPYCCVLGDVHIGNNVIILAHSVVLHDVPDNCMVGGNPARIIKTIDPPQNI